MSEFYGIDCGILPLRNRFIRLTLGETVWLVKASSVIDLAVDYYRREGWYESDDEMHSYGATKQPVGRHLRVLVELNTDLAWFTKESRLSKLRAKHVAGQPVEPPHDDYCWWFEEQGGEVEEVTNLPPIKQNPRGRLLWFSQEYADSRGIKV